MENEGIRGKEGNDVRSVIFNKKKYTRPTHQESFTCKIKRNQKANGK